MFVFIEFGQASSEHYQQLPLFYEARKAVSVSGPSVSCLTWVLGSLKILGGHSSLILEFTQLFSATRSVQVLAAVLVVITDALCVTVNAGSERIEGGNY